MPTHWVDLPDDKTYIFNATYKAAFNVLFDKTSPRTIPLYNPTDQPITIPRKIRLGIITDIEETGMLTIISLGRALATLAVGIAYVLGSSKPASSV